jgi:Zn-dependent protease with chaperone function
MLAQAVPETTREDAAVRLGTQRRRLFIISSLVSLAAPLLPYLTGAWETAWFSLAAQPWPFALRAILFLLGFYIVLSVIELPLSYYGGYVLPRAFDLGRQSRRAWAADWLKAALLGAVLGTLVGGVFLWTVIALGGSWWWAFGLIATLLGVAIVFATPYVLVPLFFRMRPLSDAATVERIHALVNRAGAPVRDVCSLDFSRRTAEANAAVIGLGRSRRVVLADTLLADFSAPEVDAVVAHELGHHVERHVQMLLVGNGVLLWLGLVLAALLTPWAQPILSLPSLAYVPGFPIVFFVVEVYYLLLMPGMNWWSRRLETSADRFALRLTCDPDAFAAAMERIGTQNLIERRPPRWSTALLASHPPLYRRVEMAHAFAEAT